MEEPTSPETPSSSPPPAETLAEKHKARRTNIHRLLSQSDKTLGELVEDQLAQEEQAASATSAADERAPQNGTPQNGALTHEVSLLEAARQGARQLGRSVRGASQKAAAGARRLGGQASAFARRLTRRERPVQQGHPAQGEAMAREGQPSAWREKVWPRLRPVLWRGRLGPAFWTVASTLSLVVNIILIVLLILLGRQLFFLKNDVVNNQLVNGLYDNFVAMDKAHIRTTITVSDTIQVKDTIPVVFDLPLNQKTIVVLTKDTPVKTTIFLNNTAVPLDLILTQGTEPNIKLDMTVPVNQSIPVTLNVPVNLQVPVDIPLDQTELHQPFVGLQRVVSPFRQLLSEVPSSWSEVCKGLMKPVCSVLKFK